MVQRKFDARHEFLMSGLFYLRDSLATRKSILLPIIMNDDARGDPMDFKAHPEHSTWAEVAQPNCFPDSEIRNMRITVDFVIPKASAIITSILKVNYALISCAFPEDLDALDEKSGLSLKEVLEIQKETTDRQTYPLWNGVDSPSGSTLHADVPGLTASQVVEHVAFDSEVLRDQKRYGRIKGLIKKCMPMGYRTLMIRSRTLAGFAKRLTINFTPSNAKFINPYTFLGLLLHVDNASAISTWDPTNSQSIKNGDLTNDTEEVLFAVHVQYDERNPEFHMGKV